MNQKLMEGIVSRDFNRHMQDIDVKCRRAARDTSANHGCPTSMQWQLRLHLSMTSCKNDRFEYSVVARLLILLAIVLGLYLCHSLVDGDECNSHCGHWILLKLFLLFQLQLELCQNGCFSQMWNSQNSFSRGCFSQNFAETILDRISVASTASSNYFLLY